MSVLVTGATGFIGTRLLQYLDGTFGLDNVVVLASREVEGVRTFLHKGWTYSTEELKSILTDNDIVFHLGATTPQKVEDFKKTDMFTANIDSTRYLLHHLPYNPKQIIFGSTIDVYDRSTNEPVMEETPIQSNHAYGLSKYYCELLVKEYCAANGCRCKIARIGNVYGPGEEKYEKLVGSFIRKCKADEDLVLFGDGKLIRNLIYVEDLCRLLVQLSSVESDCIVNLVSNQEVTIKQIAECVISTTHSRSNIVLKDKAGRNDLFNSSRKNSLLGETETPIGEGIEQTVQYMEKQVYELR